VLSGDAGHFKSPGPGRGIGDAFIQAERLAAGILGALGRGEGALDGGEGSLDGGEGVLDGGDAELDGGDAELDGGDAELDGGDAGLDGAMRRWGRWRDREFAQHYWLAYDLEKEGAVPAVLVEILCDLHAQGRAGLFFDLLNHRVRPSQVLTPPRALRASARLLRRPGRRALLGELRALGAQDFARRWRNRRPLYATT
jgi:hypothetical protein